MKKKIVAMMLAVVLASGCLTGCRVGNTEFVINTKVMSSKSVFTINNHVCSLEEARLYLCNYKNLYGNVYGVDLWDYDFGDESLQEYVKGVTLSELSRIMCMDLLAEEQGITLDADDRKIVKKAAEEYYKSLSKEEISYMGISQKHIEEYYTNYALADKLYRTLISRVDEEISDDEARVMQVQQIYVSNLNKAEEVASKLAAGENFETVAAAYNEASCMETTLARGECPKNVEDKAFGMNNDEVSDRIDVDGGYYFLKCVNKYDAELTEENKKKILTNKEKAQFEDMYHQYVDEAVTALNEKVWSKVTIEDSSAITTDTFFSVYDNCISEQAD